jgi:hypothetical protein
VSERTGAGEHGSFERSNDVERFIESFGFKYELVVVSLSEIDVKASCGNQARREPHLEDVQVTYAQALEAGARFPALIAYRTPDGRLVLIDGNQRRGGAERANFADVLVYVVDVGSEDPMLLNMIASANPTLNGYGPELEDRIVHAIAMVDRGSTRVDAARQAGVPVSTVESEYTHTRLYRKVERAGFGRLAKELPKTYAPSVLRVADKLDPAEMGELLKAAGDARNREDFRSLVDEVALHDESRDRAAVIENFRTERDKAINVKPRRRTQTGWHAFVRHAQAILNRSPEEIVASCPPDRREGLVRMAEDLRFVASKLSQ